jgi:hypothetical protein
MDFEYELMKLVCHAMTCATVCFVAWLIFR